MKTANETDWIDWPGGEKCPVDKDALVYIRLRCGKEHKEAYPAHQFMWRHLNTDADIVAYRTQPLQPPSWSKGFHNPDNLPDAGKDKRFLLVEEVHNGTGLYDWWSQTRKVWDTDGTLNNIETFRVPRDTPFPPSPAPEPVAEKPWTLSRHLPGFREVVAGEAWHKTDGWTPAMLEGGRRPLLLGETGDYEYFDEMRGWMPGGQPAKPTPKGLLRCCATRRPLPSIEPQYRALLPGEKVQEGDEMRKSGSNDPWQDSVTWRWRGIQAPGLEYRTLRPAPSTPAKEEPYLPKKGEHCECRKIGAAVWTPQLAMRDGTEDDLSRWEFRPCSPPEPSTADSIYSVEPKADIRGRIETVVPEKAEFWGVYERQEDGLWAHLEDWPTQQGAEHFKMVCEKDFKDTGMRRYRPEPTKEDLASELLSHVIKTPTELTTQIEPAMNQTQTPTTPAPSPDLPDLGSVWDIQYTNNADKSFKGTIIGRGEAGITVKSRSWIPFFPDRTVLKVADWNDRPKALRGLCRQAKESRPSSPFTLYRPGPSIFTQLRRYAYVAAIATLFANQTRTGIAKAASNLGAPEFVVQWLKA